MRDAYLSELYNLAKKNKDILALVADNGAIVYDDFRRDFSDRFINFGISEANMVSVAAGLASCGKIPFAYTIACFITMRAFEQIRNDVCLQKMNVKLVGIGAGFVYSNLGPTHHATKDIALMRVLPEMIIFSPADSLETKKATVATVEIDGPVYLRLATGKTSDIYTSDYDFKIGKGVVLKEGDDISIIATGTMVYESRQAVRDLEKLGIHARLINIHTIKPLDKEIILKAAEETKVILTVEEHSVFGGLGSAVSEILLEECNICIQFKRLGLKGVFSSEYGSHEDMKRINGISVKDIIRESKKLYERKKGVLLNRKR